MMEERQQADARAVVRWMEANRGSAGFAEALSRLVSFACAEWLRRGLGVPVPPAEALSRVALARLPDVPVNRWIESPEEHQVEIAEFCAKSKSGPLPEALRGEIPSELDLRGVKCPLNAARSRLVMTGFPPGRELSILLDEGSPIENVPGALVADGCRIVSREKNADFWKISVVKPADK